MFPKGSHVEFPHVGVMHLAGDLKCIGGNHADSNSLEVRFDIKA
jgi:hypothetical protein